MDAPDLVVPEGQIGEVEIEKLARREVKRRGDVP